MFYWIKKSIHVSMFHQKIFPLYCQKAEEVGKNGTHPPLGHSKTRFRIDEGLPVGMPGVVYRLGMDGPTLKVGDVQLTISHGKCGYVSCYKTVGSHVVLRLVKCHVW